MKTYHGNRKPGSGKDPGPVTVTNGGNGYVLLLDPRNDLVNHSEAFSWGYAGSGPCQLAVALLADALGNAELALALYQNFKNDIVSQLDDEWHLSDREVVLWVRAKVSVSCSKAFSAV